MNQCPECGSYATYYLYHNEDKTLSYWQCFGLNADGERCGHEFTLPETPKVVRTEPENSDE